MHRRVRGHYLHVAAGVVPVAVGVALSSVVAVVSLVSEEEGEGVSEVVVVVTVVPVSVSVSVGAVDESVLVLVGMGGNVRGGNPEQRRLKSMERGQQTIREHEQNRNLCTVQIGLQGRLQTWVQRNGAISACLNGFFTGGCTQAAEAGA